MKKDAIIFLTPRAGLLSLACAGCLLLLPGVQRSLAGDGAAWSSIGPSGGDQYITIPSLLDANVVYSLGHYGVRRRTLPDGDWQLLQLRNYARDTFLDIEFSPADTNEFFIASMGNGILHTTDGGATWTQLTNGLPKAGVAAFPVTSMGRSESTLYCALGATDTQHPPHWIYQSTDNGTSWSPSALPALTPYIPPHPTHPPCALLALGTPPQPLAAIINGSGVVLLRNGVWEDATGNLPNQGKRGTAIAVDPQNHGHILIGTEEDWIYRTLNGGAHWTHVGKPTELQGLTYQPLVYGLSVDPVNMEVVWVGTTDVSGSKERPLFRPRPEQTAGKGGYFSFDAGSTWISKPPVAMHITPDGRSSYTGDVPGKPNVTRSKHWFAAAGGAYSSSMSSDGGRTFSDTLDGMNNILINTLWAPPAGAAAEGYVFAGAEAGVYMAGASHITEWDFKFATLDGDGKPGLVYTWSFAACPTGGVDVLYSTGHPAWGESSRMGIFRVNPLTYGESIEPGTQILHGTGVWRVVTAPDRTTTIYAACQENGVMASDDYGQSWHTRNAGLGLPKSITDIELTPAGGLLYASSRQYNGNVEGEPPQPWVEVAREAGGVYEWSPSLEKWIPLAGFTNGVYDMELIPGSDTDFIAGTSVGVCKYTAATGWELLLPQAPARDVQIDASDPTVIYACVFNGVYRSTTSGAQWHAFNDGLTISSVNRLTQQGTGAVFVATGGNSVFLLGQPSERNPQIAVSNQEIDFGDVPAGLTRTRSLSITNTGNARLTVSAFNMPVGFELDASVPLPLSIPAESWYSVMLDFSPTTGGLHTGTVSIVSDGGPPAEVPVRGTALAPSATATPSALDFGLVGLGLATTMNVRVENAGAGPLNIIEASVAAPFSITSVGTVPFLIMPGTSATIRVAYSPTEAGIHNGVLTIGIDAADEDLLVPVTGECVTPTLGMTPEPIDFGAQLPNTTNYVQVVVTNAGPVDAVITELQLCDHVELAGSLVLPAQLDAFTSATFALALTSATEQLIASNILLRTSAGDLVRTVTANVVWPTLTATPTPLAFGNIHINQTPQQTVTISNGSPVSAMVTAVTLTGGLSVPVLPLPRLLPPGAANDIPITWTPAGAGPLTGTVSVVYSGTHSPMMLTPTGQAGIPDPAATPASLAFGSVNVGLSVTNSLSITNTGDGTLVISGIQTTTPFSLVPPPALPLLVPPGASVSLAVRYAPAATVTVTTNLTLVVNTAAGRLNVPVSGSGYYAISLGTAPAASGSASGGGSFPSGSTCTVTAVANTGYVFEDWTENSVVVSTSPSYVFTVQSNRSLVANFIAASVQLSPVYRFWSALHSGHFFTISEWEKNHIQATWPDIWSYEGVAWYALTTPATNASPVYRFWSPVYSRHFFTISEAEKNYIRTNWPDIWTYESVAWYAFPTEAPGSSPVYRFWSPLYNGHFFTVSEAEKNHIQATWPDIWSYEGIAYYVYSSAPTPTSLQRLAVPEGEKDGPAVASQDSSGTETLRRATPSAVFALKPMESAEINVSPPAEVTFALAYGADKEVTAALYDPVTNGFQAILATRLSPREIELPRLLPDRRYWICILARDTGVQDWTLDYGGWLGRLAERPETDVPVLTGKKADMLGLPIEHIVLPHSDEAINIRIYDGHDNRLIETISELQDGTIYDFNVPAWNQWFRVEVETATSKTVLQAFWIGHLRTH